MALAPSSPRLPSPPPAAEIQMTPNSPSGGMAATLETTQMEQSLLDANSKRRIHPGTKACDMAAGPPLVPLSELESAFSLQEHLAALHYHHTAQGTRALTRATARQIAQPPTGTERTLWLYELCRFLISQCNTLIVGFLFDSPPCSASTCPEMRASEWQFLCAVHEQPKSCCAIDYCCHTLDWAANVVSDQNIFPSRFVILRDNQSKNVVLKNLVNVFRRVHRIFAHAWFQHRNVFWMVEGQSGLYVFFKTVCDLYDLLPPETYKLPPEAEGLEPPESEPEPLPALVRSSSVSTILKSSSPPQPVSDSGGGGGVGSPPPSEDSPQAHGRITARRHVKSSPSTGSAVTTVMETDEEEMDVMARSLSDIHLTAPPNLSQFADEPEAAEAPATAGSSSKSSKAKAFGDRAHRTTTSKSGNDTAASPGDTGDDRGMHSTGNYEEAESAESAAETNPSSSVSAPQKSPSTEASATEGVGRSSKESSTLDDSHSTQGISSTDKGDDTSSDGASATDTEEAMAPAAEVSQTDQV